MIDTPHKLVGAASMFAAMLAGASVWIVVATAYSIVLGHRNPHASVLEQNDWTDDLILIVVALAAAAVFHGIGWIARNGTIRRTMGMSAGFWKAVYYSGYTIGFVGAGLAFLSAKR
jgi:hypothetical protein